MALFTVVGMNRITRSHSITVVEAGTREGAYTLVALMGDQQMVFCAEGDLRGLLKLNDGPVDSQSWIDSIREIDPTIEDRLRLRLYAMGYLIPTVDGWYTWVDEDSIQGSLVFPTLYRAIRHCVDRLGVILPSQWRSLDIDPDPEQMALLTAHMDKLGLSFIAVNGWYTWSKGDSLEIRLGFPTEIQAMRHCIQNQHINLLDSEDDVVRPIQLRVLRGT